MDTRRLIEGVVKKDHCSQQAFYDQFALIVRQWAGNLLKGTSGVDASLVAVSAMRRFFKRAERQQDAMMTLTRDEIRALLYQIVWNRALSERKKVLAQKRIPTSVISESDLIASPEFLQEFSETGVQFARSTVLEGESMAHACEVLKISPEDGAALFRRIKTWMKHHRLRPGRLVTFTGCAHEGAVTGEMLSSPDLPELAATARDLMEALDEQTRIVVQMRLLGNYTWAEISDAVGLSEPTARHRLEDIIQVWSSHDD